MITVIYIEKKQGKRTYKRVKLPISALIQEETRTGMMVSPANFYLPRPCRGLKESPDSAPKVGQ